jgi:hypothetical protein
MDPEAQAAADKAQADAAAKAKADADAKAAADAAAAKKQETIGQVLETTPAPKTEETVPLAVFLETKSANKELKKEIDAIKASIKDGATAKEVSADIKAIGDKYEVSSDFLTELSAVIRKDVERDTEARIAPLTAKEKADKIDRVFAEHFDRTMTDMPEFASIVNREVIKSLSLDPKNKDKTFPQLIEDTYGKAVPGKRTFETTTHRGGNAADGIDYQRAAQDPKYYAELMSNPDTKKEYNAGLTDRLSANL